MLSTKYANGHTVRWLLAAALMTASMISGTNAFAAWNCNDQSKHTVEATQPPNIGQIKYQLRDYYYCGGYQKDFTKKIEEAKAYLEQHARWSSKPALVLDIDETSLSNWLEINQDDFGYIPGGGCTLQPGLACGVAAWELSARAEALKPTLDLFNAAKSWGVTVFFITGRQDRSDLRAATIKNLEEAGYQGWKELIMRPIASAGSVTEYKSSERAAIEAQGYKIIVDIGDQQSDLDGGHAEKAFRVPNPFYYIP